MTIHTLHGTISGKAEHFKHPERHDDEYAQRDHRTHHGVFNDEVFNPFGYSPRLLVGSTNGRPQDDMTVAERLPELLQDPFSQVLFPATGADDNVKFHLQCRIGQGGAEERGDDIVCDLGARSKLFC